MAGMKVNLAHAFKQIGHDLPSYAPVLEDVERHLRETIAGEHTLHEFAQHYCLTPMRTLATQSELHNQIAGQIVASIVKPPLDAGGTMSDVLVVLESVVVGVILMGVKLGGDEIVLDTMVENVRKRLAEHRLGKLDAAGSA